VFLFDKVQSQDQQHQERMEESTGIEALADELLLKILPELDPQSLARLCVASKRLGILVQASLWSRLGVLLCISLLIQLTPAYLSTFCVRHMPVLCRLTTRVFGADCAPGVWVESDDSQSLLVVCVVKLLLECT
jgi:hypothetical protein